MRWTSLRPIQCQAIHSISDSDHHLIISASTAGGKTEAAFLPILSFIAGNSTGGIQALYVGPLKALINDQFRRLEDLCERAELPVHRWHGDVNASRKRRLIENPRGVLLITPESIESLFINRTGHLKGLFSNLRFVVIDEMHSFIGTERGAHLRSLLFRLQAKSKQEVQFVGLSATLGDMDLARGWMVPWSDTNVALIEDQGDGKEVQYRIHGYEVDFEDRDTDQQWLTFARDLHRHFYGRSALIFANSRVFLENLADCVRTECRRRKLQDRFRIHHGSLSKAVREEAEAALRSDSPTCTFCTTTLEMGIDVGSVELIGQVQPPWTVNSLAQRLGRSGRGEDQARVMRHFVLERKVNKDDGIIPRLYPSLLQAVAITELMLEGWYEPPDVARAHLSTLVQQILSLIRESGSIRARFAYESLVLPGAFNHVTEDAFVALLRSIADCDLIEQAPDGSLILGLAGEKIVNSFEFYSAFQTDDEFQVIHQGTAIGTVSAMHGLEVNSAIILAGRRWRIIAVYEEERRLLVEPSLSARLPSFSGGLAAEVHPKVRERMRDVLFSDSKVLYLDDRAAELLDHARDVATNLNLRNLQLYQSRGDFVWFTWTGSRTTRTLSALFQHYGKIHADDEGIGIAFEKSSPGEVVDFLVRILKDPPSAEELASSAPVTALEKYDPYIGKELRVQQIASNCLDMAGAIAAAKSLLASVGAVPPSPPKNPNSSASSP